MNYLILVSISCVVLWTIMLIIALLRYWNKADEYRSRSDIYKNYVRILQNREKQLKLTVSQKEETIARLRSDLMELNSQNERQLKINAKLMERIKKGLVHE